MLLATQIAYTVIPNEVIMSINTNITRDNIKLAYQKMARDKQREKEAREWEEGLIQNDLS